MPSDMRGFCPRCSAASKSAGDPTKPWRSQPAAHLAASYYPWPSERAVTVTWMMWCRPSVLVRWTAFVADAVFVSSVRSAAREVAAEPVGSQPGHRVKRARLLKQVTGSGNYRQLALRTEPLLGLPVQPEHDLVPFADNEQRRRAHRREPGLGQIRSATPTDDGGHARGWFRCRAERRRSARARSEIADRSLPYATLLPQPQGHGGPPAGAALHVGHVCPGAVLRPRGGGGPQRPPASVLECGRHR